MRADGVWENIGGMK
ncbi:hypothetical protein [Escherichia coli]